MLGTLAPMQPNDLAYAGAAEQARLIRDREASAREVVEATLEQIDRLDSELRAYRVVFAERALAEADSLRRRARTTGRSAASPSRSRTTPTSPERSRPGGTRAHGAPKAVDSDVVVRLREAGAIVIGKTQVPEMTMWPWTVSAGYGSVRNPWGMDRTPGGSSGGSAAAAATGHVRRRARLGRRRLDPLPVGAERPVRDQDAARPHLARAGPSRRLERAQRHGPLARTRRRRGAVPRRDLAERARRRVRRGARGVAAPAAVAVSFKPPRGSLARLGGEQRRAVESTAELLRSLGHEVIEREVDMPFTLILNLTIRYLRGLRHDIGTLPRPDLPERNTRRMAALGGLVTDGILEKARRDEAELAARVNRIYDGADVVLMPMIPGQAPRSRT